VDAKKLFNKCGTKWPFFVTFTMTFFMIIYTFVGLRMDRMLINGAKQCSCSMTGFLHELVWGQTYKKSDDPTKWIGMEAIVGKDGEFDKIIDQLTKKIPNKIAASFNTDVRPRVF
jgi:hypothetical protein